MTCEFHIYSVRRDLLVLTDELLLREEEPMLNISDLSHVFNINRMSLISLT